MNAYPVKCPPAERPEFVPHRARRTCPVCGTTWLAVGFCFPRWRPARWWHRIARRREERTP